MKNYYRVMLGKGSVFAKECLAGGYIGTDFLPDSDLNGKLYENWREFNREFIPVYLALHPGKTKVAAGLACGALWTVSKGIKRGDIVLSPDGEGHYLVGEVIGDYTYQESGILPHRRAVAWSQQTIDRAKMSSELKNSTGSAGTVAYISGYSGELDALIRGENTPVIVIKDPTVENPSEFAMEKHLEDFLVQNWSKSLLAKDYDIYRVDGAIVGQQFQTDTGPIDILALSKDKKSLLVVELKKGRASDVVVGQIQRYMGYVKDELSESGQIVRGIIIALEDDHKMRRALSVTQNIEFYRYQIDFKLVKA